MKANIFSRYTLKFESGSLQRFPFAISSFEKKKLGKSIAADIIMCEHWSLQPNKRKYPYILHKLTEWVRFLKKNQTDIELENHIWNWNIYEAVLTKNRVKWTRKTVQRFCFFSFHSLYSPQFIHLSYVVYCCLFFPSCILQYM